MKSLEESKQYLDEMAQELQTLMDFDIMEMYRFLTDIGNSIPAIANDRKIPDNFVKGCTSNVYVDAAINNGGIQYSGSSEAHIVRGYLCILINALSGLAPEQFLSGSRSMIEGFAEATNLKAALTPSRANAFGNIYALMAEKAKALGTQA